LTFGHPDDQHVTATPIETPPYLSFSASDRNDVELVSECAARAAARVEANDFGSIIWYSPSLEEPKFNYFTAHGGIGSLMLRLGTQIRIAGWRRLGRDVLLEFEERPPLEGNPDSPLVAPPASVKAHLAIPGPIAGLFSDLIAHRVIETVAATCGFALGRSIDPPIALFPATTEQSAGAAAEVSSRSV
jgi:hypothetical protein